MVLWSDLYFKDKNFFILFPWQKYKCIFMNDTLIEKIMKIVLILFFIMVLITDITRILIWNVFLRPIYWLQTTRKFITDQIMDLDVDNPFHLIIKLITYPILGIWFFIDSIIQTITIIPIILFSLVMNVFEQFSYYIYTYKQQKNELIEKRQIQFTAKGATYIFTGFSISAIGGKTYTTSFNMNKVNSISKYVPIVGILSYR